MISWHSHFVMLIRLLNCTLLSFPDGTLIAMIRRGDEMVIPTGDTELIDGDRLTVIGRPEEISALRNRYGVVAPA